MRTFKLFMLFAVLFSACSDNDSEDIKGENVTGSVIVYYNGEKIELNEITVSRFTYIDVDVSGKENVVRGTTYCAFSDERHLQSANSFFLDISENSDLAGITFNYSSPGSGYSDSYRNYYKNYDKEATALSYDVHENNNTLSGKIKGKLYHDINILDIDSCVFYINKKIRH